MTVTPASLLPVDPQPVDPQPSAAPAPENTPDAFAHALARANNDDTKQKDSKSDHDVDDAGTDANAATATANATPTQGAPGLPAPNDPAVAALLAALTSGANATKTDAQTNVTSTRPTTEAVAATDAKGTQVPVLTTPKDVPATPATAEAGGKVPSPEAPVVIAPDASTGTQHQPADQHVPQPVVAPGNTNAPAPVAAPPHPATPVVQQQPDAHAQGPVIGAPGAIAPQAQTGEASAPATVAASSPAPPPPPADQLFNVVRPLQRAPDGSYHLRIEMRPPELGRVEMRVEMRDGVLHASIHTEHAATAQIVRDALDDLRARLNAEGVQTGELNVADGRSQERDADGERAARNGDDVDLTSAVAASTDTTAGDATSDALLDIRI